MQDPDFKESQHQRHLRDIVGIVEQQDLDHTYLNQQIESLNLSIQWQAALSLTSS